MNIRVKQKVHVMHTTGHNKRTPTRYAQDLRGTGGL